MELTLEQRKAIASSSLSTYELAEKYGVHRMTISRIKKKAREGKSLEVRIPRIGNLSCRKCRYFEAPENIRHVHPENCHWGFPDIDRANLGLKAANFCSLYETISS